MKTKRSTWQRIFGNLKVPGFKEEPCSLLLDLYIAELQLRLLLQLLLINYEMLHEKSILRYLLSRKVLAKPFKGNVVTCQILSERGFCMALELENCVDFDISVIG